MLYRFDGKEPTIGKESYVSPMATIIGDVVIGDNCYVGPGAILRGDYGRIEIGSGSAVEEGVIVHAPPGETTAVGERVTVGHGAVVHSASVGADAVVGMGAILSIRSKVGANTIVAEGCVVKMNQIVPENVVVAGNPAAVVRPIRPRDEELWRYGKQLYIDLARKYLEVGLEPIEDL